MKTTITGLISASTAFVMFAQEMPVGSPLHMNLPSWVVLVAMFANVGGLAALGITAKDYNATGGTIPKTEEAEYRVQSASPAKPGA